MNMNDFQRLTLASMGETRMIEHVRAGVRALTDHVEEARDAAVKMDGAETAEQYVDQRKRLEAMLGFILVDVAEICEGLNTVMGDVAMINLQNLMRHARLEQTKLCHENADGKGVLRAILELAGKAVHDSE